MTLSPKLGVVEISILRHFRLQSPIQIFINVASSSRPSGIGTPSPILWSHPLNMQRIVLLSSLLWWELRANSQTTGQGEWLSFGVSPVNNPDPDPGSKSLRPGRPSRYNHYKVQNGDWSRQDKSDDKQPKWLPKRDLDSGSEARSVENVKYLESIISNEGLNSDQIKVALCRLKIIWRD